MPKIPSDLKETRESKCWVDWSVLDEMALRLRGAKLWDNNIADGLQLLKSRIEMLERFSRYERWETKHIDRPLKTWEDCRRLLVVIASSRFSTFSDIAAPVEACLNLALMLASWETAKKAIPTDIRGMMYGAICVEWPKKSLIIDGKGNHRT